MDYSVAKHKVLSLYSEFRENKDSSIYQKLSVEDVLHTFYALRNRLPANDPHLNISFALFICFTINRFDRFGVLRPDDNEELRSKYLVMLQSLRKLEPVRNIYSWLFQMNRIKWDIYRECANKTIGQDILEYIDNKACELQKINIPGADQHDTQLVEKKRREIMDLLNAFRSGIITTVETRLPYKLTQKNSTFHLTCDGVEVDVSIENSMKSSPLPLIEIAHGSTLDELGLSKNSYSESKLTLRIHCLVDVGISLDSVSYSEKEQFGWNYLFDFTYRTIKSIWNYLQSAGDDYVTWPPLPQDIGTINWSIATGQLSIDSGVFSNPATGFRISCEKRGIQHHEIKDETAPLWSENAFYYARLYAKAGQFEETVFWINVATEALIDEFIRKISPDQKAYEDLSMQESKFQSAEEILANQFPEMKGKVQWPNSIIPASVYTKLKRALEYLKQDKKQTNNIIKSYSSICAKRNCLFHGGNHSINTTDISKVFQSFYQLKDFFSKF